MAQASTDLDLETATGEDSAYWTTPDGWRYSLLPEGHLWRFRGIRASDTEGGKPTDVDFGLLPGGAFVAIERLVMEHGLSRWSIEEGQLIIGELSTTLALLAGDDGLKACGNEGCPGHLKEKANAECKKAMAWIDGMENSIHAVIKAARPQVGSHALIDFDLIDACRKALRGETGG